MSTNLPRTPLELDKAFKFSEKLFTLFENHMLNENSPDFIGDVDSIPEEYTIHELLGGFLIAETLLYNLLHGVEEIEEGANLLEVNNLNNMVAQIITTKSMLVGTTSENSAELMEQNGLLMNEKLSLVDDLIDNHSEILPKLSFESRQIIERMTNLNLTTEESEQK